MKMIMEMMRRMEEEDEDDEDEEDDEDDEEDNGEDNFENSFEKEIRMKIILKIKIDRCKIKKIKIFLYILSFLSNYFKFIIYNMYQKNNNLILYYLSLSSWFYSS